MKTAAPPKRRLATSRESLAHKPLSSALTPLRDGKGSLTPRTQPSSRKEGAAAAPEWPGAGSQFYFNSLTVQVWLAKLHQYTVNQYVGRAKGEERPLQTGHAWRTFLELFEPLAEIELVRLFENLLRFANYEADPPARAFFLAYAPLAFEHDASGEYIGPGVWTREAGSKDAALRVRRTLERWCEWQEALAHFQTHKLCHPELSCHNLDKTIIFLWPFLKRHDWSYRELRNLVRSLLHFGADVYPCQSEHQFARYCRTVLGLRKVGLPTAAKSSALAGRAVAERLFRFLPVFL